LITFADIYFNFELSSTSAKLTSLACRQKATKLLDHIWPSWLLGVGGGGGGGSSPEGTSYRKQDFSTSQFCRRQSFSVGHFKNI